MPRHRSKELQVVRCLGLLVAMARARRGVQLRAFYDRQDWSWRSAYRDVKSLRAVGVPVEQPEHGWFRVPQGWLPAGAVDVKRDELRALLAAARLVPGLRETSIGRALVSLWSKLASPGRQGELALDDDAWLASHTPAPIDYAAHQIVLDELHEAVRQRRAITIRYRKPDGRESERVIEPAVIRWEASTEALYVVGWCRTRDQVRTFAVHRIIAARLTDDRFAPRDAVAMMSKAYRLWARPAAERVVLRFSPRIAGEIRERRWHASERRSETVDGELILELEVGAPEELERQLLGYGADVVVEHPTSLAELIRRRHAEAIAPERFGTLRAGELRQRTVPASEVRKKP